MKIIELKKPNLPKVKMVCDESIDKKLEEIPAIKTCFSKSHTTLISGGCGSGKTTTLIQLIKGLLKGCYEDIFLIMPENSYGSIDEKDNIFKKYLDEENIYHEYNEEILEEIYEKLEDNSSNGYHSLVIIDDWGHLLKDRGTEKILEKMILKNRHLRTSMFILTQQYYMLGKKLREIMTNVIMFNTNKSQNKKFFEEQFNMPENNFNELMTLLPNIHSYLILNLKYKKIYHNWNEIIFD